MRTLYGIYMVISLFVMPLLFGSTSGGSLHSSATADTLRDLRIEHTWHNTDTQTLTDSTRNVITDSAGNMLPLMAKLASLRRDDSGVVSILHIGDSHVQAGYMTGRLRELFQSDFGNAGRGLIIPSKLAGMNEARDYAIKAAYPYHTAKATTQGEKTGFTGISLTSDTPYFEFAIWSKEPFDAVTVLHHESAPALMEPDSLNPGTYCTIYNTPQSTRIVLNRTTDSLTLNGFTDKVFNRPEYYGFSLENGGSGLLYHALGLNSAAFEHFASGTTLLAGGAAALMPDIIIVSLGTNNCYGNNFDAGRLGGVADNFIRRLKQAYPDAALLITTPMESCNKSGRKRIPNTNVREAAVVIKAAAAKNEVACWDLFEAAGGNGANEKWYKRKLTSRDRIHFTEEGYILQADMLYDAFAKYYNSSLTLQKDSTACLNS